MILPITKSPHSKGRLGPIKWQDWYRGLIKTQKLASANPQAKILVLSAVHIEGEKTEALIYQLALEQMSFPAKQLIVIEKGYETIEQVEVAKQYANQNKAELLVISTFLHYPRVRWLFRGYRARHFIVFGLPRPREILTDIVLNLIFPIIDLIGLRQWFKNQVITRRKKGKF